MHTDAKLSCRRRVLCLCTELMEWRKWISHCDFMVQDGGIIYSPRFYEFCTIPIGNSRVSPPLPGTIANLFLLTYFKVPAQPVGNWDCSSNQSNLVAALAQALGRETGGLRISSLIGRYSAYLVRVPVSVLNWYSRLRQKPVNAGTIGNHIEVPHSSRVFE